MSDELEVGEEYGYREGYGWGFAVVTAQGVRTPIYPAAAGSLEYDGSREVSKTLRGLVFLPNEWRKFSPVADEIHMTLYMDGVEHPMGYFTTNEAPTQYRVLLDPDTNEVSNLTTASFGDRLSRLIRSDGRGQTIQAGFDPAQEAIDLLSFSGVPYGWENSVSVGGSTITWDGATTLLQKVVQLSLMAGHRNPWMNNDGVVRSVVATTPVPEDPSILDVESALNLEAASVVITPLYLTAPNVVIVSDNSGMGDQLIMGRWDAPSIAPHSYVNRGYFYTQMENIQGLRDEDHANKVARAIGEKNSAQVLNFRCQPTWLIDGPTILQYAGSLWVVTRYSIDLAPGGLMDVQAEELTGDSLLEPGVLA